MYSFDFDEQTHHTNINRSSSASLNAALFGVPKFLFQNGLIETHFNIKIHMHLILPYQWTYIYDNTPLKKTRNIYRFEKVISKCKKKIPMLTKKFKNRRKIARVRFFVDKSRQC